MRIKTVQPEEEVVFPGLILQPFYATLEDLGHKGVFLALPVVHVSQVLGELGLDGLPVQKQVPGRHTQPVVAARLIVIDLRQLGALFNGL